MSSEENWISDKTENGWEMPSAPRWKRLPVVRHIRAVRYMWFVAEHEFFWRQLGMVPSGYDRWVAYGVRKGWERPQ